MQTNTASNFNKMVELSKEVFSFYQTNHFELLSQKRDILFFFIMNNVITRFMVKNDYDVKKLRKELIEDVKDFSFFRSNIRGLKKYSKVLQDLWGSIEAKRILFLYDYLCDNHFILFTIRFRGEQIIRKVTEGVKRVPHIFL
jgi:hypothetical protein